MAKKRPVKPPAGATAAGHGEIKATWTVENVVATVAIDLGPSGEKFDLNQIARKFQECEYNPERFPGLVMRIADPKATILIFSTGKMVVTGLRDAGEAEAVVAIVIKNLKQAKVNITTEPEITIQNLVASGDLHVPIDLNEASIVMENAMYEPETFPGLIYRMQEPKTVFLIFSTGRIVCTGAKTKEMVGEAVEKLVGEVKSLGLAMTKGGLDTGLDAGDDEEFK
ncbi:MAG TPA: TATA-box-binding protein [Candidatus Lokiarchaeia archaeon]|nr:TATA-box-binding protein [Candidatus Lokiarchaeia archaeon]